ncbi:desulfoferrodoxin family protein [Treponema brennaborense]|uniref:Desulfoferrodoxin ferrous iron-binding region n=1 Tax=Treponema brennaborense (strain DSM 12168 / CIP 105900 / DD5/3) TaxID=906968 RepID=F4LL05_TREBD|nr:desulfoferrodoxin family protein [Treponema brennaborense]AEE16602.1 Desulfoferrodoxin ferrous iron-binding region [Treponema brennaborense DSM 12168]
MNMNTEFLLCGDCKSVLLKIPGTVPNAPEGTAPLAAGVVEASHEKHVPVAVRHADTVSVDVGSTLHPMTAEHYILWILLRTDTGFHIRTLAPGQEPKADFVLAKQEKPVTVYAMCNIHGLWQADM